MTENNDLVSLSNRLSEAVAEAGTRVVAVHGRRRIPASGVIWKNGIVVAAAHTIEHEGPIPITAPDGQRLDATLIGADGSTDLAVLRVEGLAGTTVPDTSDSPRVGEIVLAVARPGEAGISATMGVLSALGGAWRTWSGGSLDAFIRPDLTLYPGFSGGPLISASGAVIGINTSGLTRGMPIAIPVSTVQRVATQLLAHGRIARGYLGVGVQSVQIQGTQRDAAGTDRGVLVLSLEEGGPAAQGGLLVGDIVTSIGETATGDPRDVQTALGPETAGQRVTVRVVRGDSAREIEITVGERGR